MSCEWSRLQRLFFVAKLARKLGTLVPRGKRHNAFWISEWAYFFALISVNMQDKYSIMEV